MSPPIRSEESQKKVRGGLISGNLQLIATDHAVFNLSQKAAGLKDFRKIPNGVNGIEASSFCADLTLPKACPLLFHTMCCGCQLAILHDGRATSLWPHPRSCAGATTCDLGCAGCNRYHCLSRMPQQRVASSNMHLLQ